MRRMTIAASIVLATAAVACGDSAEETAQTKVCDARASIKSDIAEIKALPVAAASRDAAAAALRSIRDSLREIRGAQEDLSPQRREDVENATKAFGTEVRTAIATSAGTGATTGGAGTAADELGTAYEQAFRPVDCSDSGSGGY